MCVLTSIVRYNKKVALGFQLTAVSIARFGSHYCWARAACDQFDMQTFGWSHVCVLYACLAWFNAMQVIREDAGNGVFVAGAREVPVSSLEECLHHLAVGEQNRWG